SARTVLACSPNPDRPLCAGATAPVSSYYIARSTPRRHAAARRVFFAGLDESLPWRPPFGMTRECWKPIVFKNCGHNTESEIRRCRAGKANAVGAPRSGVVMRLDGPLQRTSIRGAGIGNGLEPIHHAAAASRARARATVARHRPVAPVRVLFFCK